MKTVFWHPTGPLLRYGDGVLEIEDLNPQIGTKWAISRWEAVKIAVKLLFAALT